MQRPFVCQLKLAWVYEGSPRSAVHPVSTPPAAGRPQRRKPCQARWACRPGQPSVPAATPFAFRNNNLVVF
jgi:hypothetical protein